jgi:hypothetical protein
MYIDPGMNMQYAGYFNSLRTNSLAVEKCKLHRLGFFYKPSEVYKNFQPPGMREFHVSLYCL